MGSSCIANLDFFTVVWETCRALWRVTKFGLYSYIKEVAFYENLKQRLGDMIRTVGGYSRDTLAPSSSVRIVCEESTRLGVGGSAAFRAVNARL